MKKITYEELYDAYFIQRKKVVDIAEIFCVSSGTIFNWIRKFGFAREKVLNYEDISGQRFGKLVVLEFQKVGRFGKAFWKVRCDCGKEKVINASGMKAGLVVSCGCLKHESNFGGHEGISGAYWRKLNKSAAHRGIPVSVTIKEAWDRYENQKRLCALSGVPITLSLNNDRYRSQTASLDRILSSGPYSFDNIQWVHKRVNFLKRNYSETELIFWCSKISNVSVGRFVELDPNTLTERRDLNASIECRKT